MSGGSDARDIYLTSTRRVAAKTKPAVVEMTRTSLSDRPLRRPEIAQLARDEIFLVVHGQTCADESFMLK